MAARVKFSALPRQTMSAQGQCGRAAGDRPARMANNRPPPTLARGPESRGKGAGCQAQLRSAPHALYHGVGAIVETYDEQGGR